jgi:LCP family protein required for cell wall assembly
VPEPDDARLPRIAIALAALVLLGVLVSGAVLSARVLAANTRLAAERLAPRPPVAVPEPAVATAPSAAPANPVGGFLSAAQRVMENAPRPVNPQPPALPQLPACDRRERLNVLLLGIDHRPDEPLDGSRSDTMMIVSVDPASKSVVMVSLPRDLWVPIPGLGEQRINVAHAWGGPPLAVRTVSEDFRVKIDRFARIDFRGFERLVDAAYGVPIDVEKPIKDDEYPTENYGVMRVFIPAGPQWMDGRTALQYARSRHSEDDFGRAKRQQRVLVAVKDRVLQAGMIWKAQELVPLLSQVVTHDFSPIELLCLARVATEIKRDNVSNMVIDGMYVSPFITYDGAQVLSPNRAAISAAIQQTFTRAAAAATAGEAVAAPQASPTVPPAPSPTPSAPARLEVLNGTVRPGLAQTTASYLQARGASVVNVGNADRTDYPESRVLYRPGREASAAALASLLGIPPSAITPMSAEAATGADISVVLGGSYQTPAR